jgi:hypothetical protein
VLTEDWLLVLRHAVWIELRASLKVLKHARVVIFEELARQTRHALGGDEEFDKFVFNIIGNRFAQAWQL